MAWLGKSDLLGTKPFIDKHYWKHRLKEKFSLNDLVLSPIFKVGETDLGRGKNEGDNGESEGIRMDRSDITKYRFRS